MSDRSIEELVARAKNGDSTAMNKLYVEYKDKLYKFIIKQGLSSQDAEDVVSDTLVEVMKHIGDLHKDELFGTWLHRIAINKANAFRQKMGRWQRAEFDTADSMDSDLSKIDGEAAAIEQAYEESYGDTVMLPSDYAENEDIKRLLAEQINSLSDEHKEALLLYYYENRSVAEIAEITGTNPNNVKARLFNARKNLKKKLEALQEQGFVLSAVPISSLMAQFKGGLIGAGVLGGTSAVSAVSSTATSVSSVSGSAAATSATGSVAAGGASSTSTITAGSASATSTVTAAATASGAKIAAIILAATIAVGGAAAAIKFAHDKYVEKHSDDSETVIDADVQPAKTEPESESEAEPAAEPEEQPYILKFRQEDIEIDLDKASYVGWESGSTYPDGYVLIKDFTSSDTDYWLLTEVDLDNRTLTPIENKVTAEGADAYCVINDTISWGEGYIIRFFQNGEALFVNKDNWIAVFPAEARIDVHPMSVAEPKENWFYGLVLDDTGKQYDGTYEWPYNPPQTTFPNDGKLHLYNNNRSEYSVDYFSDYVATIDPDTLRPIVDTTALEKPQMDESWKQPYIETIKNCVAANYGGDFAGTEAKMRINIMWLEDEALPMCHFELYEDPVFAPGQTMAFPTVLSEGFMVIKNNQVLLTQDSVARVTPAVWKDENETALRFENYNGFATRNYSYLILDDSGLTRLVDLDWMDTPKAIDPYFSEETGYTEATVVSEMLSDLHSLAEMEEAIMNYEYVPAEEGSKSEE